MFDRCPNCNHYLTQIIEYSYGNPTIHRYCKMCGWDSYNLKTYATTQTHSIPEWRLSSSTATFIDK